MNVFNILRRSINFAERKLSRPISNPEQMAPYINKGDSLFFPNFHLSIPMPVKDKIYLSVGNDSMVGGRFIFESPAGEVIVGNRVYMAGGDVICTNKIIIEDDVFVSWNVYFFDNDSHSLDYRDRKEDMTNHLNDWRRGNTNYNLSKNWVNVRSAPIRICKYAWIGMEVKILKGVTIGEGAIIGAGSVVTKDVNPWTIVAGNPARVIRTMENTL